MLFQQQQGANIKRPSSVQSVASSNSSVQPTSSSSYGFLGGLTPTNLQSIQEQGNSIGSNQYPSSPPQLQQQQQQQTTFEAQNSSQFQPQTTLPPAPLLNSPGVTTASKEQADTLTRENDAFDDVIGSVLNDITTPTPPPAALGYEAPSPQQQLTKQQYSEISFRGWISEAFATFANETPPAERDPYTDLAILVAIKLTQLLVEAEKNTVNPIPLSSITPKAVLIQLNYANDMVSVVDVVVKNTIPRGQENSADTTDGAKMQRLYAMGVIFYELFSRESLFGDESSTFLSNSMASKSSAAADATVVDLSLAQDDEDGDEDGGDRRRRRRSNKKKPHLSSSNSNRNEFHREAIAKLELSGIPHSLCSLVGNLLDCSQGDFQSDNAYRSLSEVLTDLQLMKDDPSCFLDDLHVGSHACFEIRDKFYGRDGDISKIQTTYQRHVNGECSGMIVSGGAGVGKSSLVSKIMSELSNQNAVYYLEAKFDKNDNMNPLSTIGAMLNTICDMFAQDATQDQLQSVAKELESSLGDQASLLLGVLPSLTKLMTCSTSGVASDECYNPGASMQFLFRKLLQSLSHHRRMILLLDDLQVRLMDQLSVFYHIVHRATRDLTTSLLLFLLLPKWADPASRLVITSLISNNNEVSSVFFACCYRDDDVKEGDPFMTWLSTIKPYPLEVFRIEDIDSDGVNQLLSEALHLSPRFTRPLASILHHKSRGNPVSFAVPLF